MLKLVVATSYPLFLLFTPVPQVNIKQRKYISRRAVTFTERKPVMAVVVKKGFW